MLPTMRSTAPGPSRQTTFPPHDGGDEIENDVAAAWWAQQKSYAGGRMKTRFLQEAMANRWKSQTANSSTARGPNYCDDALASGSGRAGPCAYDCVALQQAYLPQTTHTVKCFVYDASTGGWPQNLLKRIQVRQDTDVYVAPVAGVPHESVNFTVGSSTGKSCTDVLVRVNTTTHGHQAQWTVSNRDNTSDAVKFVSPSGTGIFERTMCLHGRNWTIENSQTSGWQGTVGVVGWLPFRNTIVIPDVSDKFVASVRLRTWAETCCINACASTCI